MSEYILVDRETGLIYGPYETCETARAHADAGTITAWEIITDGDKLVDWSRPDPIAAPDASFKDAVPVSVCMGNESAQNAQAGANAL